MSPPDELSFSVDTIDVTGPDEPGGSYELSMNLTSSSLHIDHIPDQPRARRFLPNNDVGLESGREQLADLLEDTINRARADSVHPTFQSLRTLDDRSVDPGDIRVHGKNFGKNGRRYLLVHNVWKVEASNVESIEQLRETVDWDNLVDAVNSFLSESQKTLERETQEGRILWQVTDLLERANQRARERTRERIHFDERFDTVEAIQPDLLRTLKTINSVLTSNEDSSTRMKQMMDLFRRDHFPGGDELNHLQNKVRAVQKKLDGIRDDIEQTFESILSDEIIPEMLIDIHRYDDHDWMDESLECFEEFGPDHPRFFPPDSRDNPSVSNEEKVKHYCPVQDVLDRIRDYSTDESNDESQSITMNQ